MGRLLIVVCICTLSLAHLASGVLDEPLTHQQQLFRSIVLFGKATQYVETVFNEEILSRQDDGKVYLFAASIGCQCALEYLENGEMKGFFYDLVMEVCEEAGKNCEMVYDSLFQCYTHIRGDHPRAGEGLLNRNYDACMAWLKTPERLHSVAFTDGFWQLDTPSYFFVKSGNPKNFEASNIEGKKIGFLSGIVSDLICLENSGLTVATSTDVFIYDRVDQLFGAVENEEIDAVFILNLSAAGTYVRYGDQFERVAGSIDCGLDGLLRAMTRKDSGLLSWFDEALAKIKTNGKYDKVCLRAQIEHGHMGPVHCISD